MAVVRGQADITRVMYRAIASSLIAVLVGLTVPSGFAGPAYGAGSAESPGVRGLRMLQDIEAAITDLAERVKPSVVSISPAPVPAASRERSRGPSRERFRRPRGTGSGVIIDQEGHIATNNHVVGDAEEVIVRLSDESHFTGQVVGKDPDSDLALVKITSDRPFPNTTFADSRDVKVGQWALAVGNPFGLDRTVTLGGVSGVGRENINLARYENFIQTDSSIFPGNSGGPLFNLRGEVIGINTAVINSVQGIGFAIPSNMVKEVVFQLLEYGKVTRGWLGVGIQHVTQELGTKFGVQAGEGVLVNEVFENDPAARGGVQPGDIITKVDGQKVASPNSLRRLIAELRPGATTRIEVFRDHTRLELLVALSERKENPVVASLPSPELEETLGLHVQDLTPELANRFKVSDKQGALISKVDPGSVAQAEDLRAGDLITEVNRIDIRTVREYTEAVGEVKRGETILLRVLREARAFYVILKNPGK